MDRRKRRDEQVYAGAAFGGVKAEAGLGFRVVGDLGAAIRIEVHVGVARHDYGKAARGEQGAEPDREGQRERLFRPVAESSARVVSAMGSVEDHNKARRGWGRLSNGGCAGRDGQKGKGRSAKSSKCRSFHSSSLRRDSLRMTQ